jgi:hypothetical protein
MAATASIARSAANNINFFITFLPKGRLASGMYLEPGSPFLP